MKNKIQLVMACTVCSLYLNAQPTPADHRTPIKVDNTRIQKQDTAGASMLAEVSAAYNDMEKALELMYYKLMQESKSNIEEINNQIKDLQNQIQALKEQVKKIEQTIEEMEKQKAKSLSELEKQKNKAIIEVNKRITEKKPQQAKDESQLIIINVQKAKEDSLKKIKLRYNYIN